MITEEDIKSIIQDKANYSIAYEKVRDLIEPIIITTAMEITNRNQSESARLLGVNRGTFGKNLKNMDYMKFIIHKRYSVLLNSNVSKPE